jgi:hypothetical protein
MIDNIRANHSVRRHKLAGVLGGQLCIYRWAAGGEIGRTFWRGKLNVAYLYDNDYRLTSYAVSARMLSTGLKELFLRLPKKFGLASKRALKLPRACSGWRLFIEIFSMRDAGLRAGFFGSFAANLLGLDDCPQTVSARLRAVLSVWVESCRFS